MSVSVQEPTPSSYVVLLSGTHVTGKETLAASVAKSLGCPWIKAEMAHGSAHFGSRSQVERGYDYGQVFGRIWLAKLRRLGFLSDGNELHREPRLRGPRSSQAQCMALLSCYAMRKPARDAIRDVLLAHSIKPIFVILQITKETLSGRTLGAEEPELAERIMREKMADIEEPPEEEKDVILVDAMRDVDALSVEIRRGIIILGGLRENSPSSCDTHLMTSADGGLGCEV